MTPRQRSRLTVSGSGPRAQAPDLPDAEHMSLLAKIREAVSLLRPRHIAELDHRIGRLAAAAQEAGLAAGALESRLRADSAALQTRLGREGADVQKEIARLAKRQAEAVRNHVALREQIGGLSSGIDSIRAMLVTVSEQLTVHSRRLEQLTTAYRTDWDRRASAAAAAARIQSVDVAEHVRRAIQGAALVLDPFPHVVVEGVLPDEVYDHLVDAVPPRAFFEDRPVNDQQLAVPFEFAPDDSKAVWGAFAELVESQLGPGFESKFHDLMEEYIHSTVPAARGERLLFHASNLRLMLRRPGYVIAPHRDPKWGFVTVLFNIARPGDSETFGTHLYRVHDDNEAPSELPYWIDQARCELVGTVPFRRNAMLAFLNGYGAHGASIPADAPPDTERYQFQFRIGPVRSTLIRLVELMPDEARAKWQGGKLDRLSLGKSY